MSGRPRHRISHPFHNLPPGRFHTSSSRTPSPSTSRSPPRGRVAPHLQSHIFDSIHTTLQSSFRTNRPRQRRASNMPAWTVHEQFDSTQPHRVGEVVYGKDPVHRERIQANFEWVIYDIKDLIKHVVRDSVDPMSLDMEQQLPDVIPDALKRGVVVGEKYYKVEIARTTPNGHSAHSTVDDITADGRKKYEECKSLSLYVGALYLDLQAIELEYDTTIEVGIRSTYTNIGLKHGRSNYIWHHEAVHAFNKNDDYTEIILPDFGNFLEQDPYIAETDALSICITLTSSADEHPHFSPQNQVTVPSNIINGLGDLIDSRTGDVKFVCLEHDYLDIDDVNDSKSLLSQSRKRVIYAHAEILKARSEYFKALLSGGFSESHECRNESNQTTIYVDDADYKTVYGMLRYLYTNELIFAEGDENVRALMEQLSLDRGEVRRFIRAAPGYSGKNEWQYRVLSSDMEELGDSLDQVDFDDSMTVSSVGTSVSQRVERGRAGSPAASIVSSGSAAPKLSTPKSPSKSSGSGSSSSTLTQRTGLQSNAKPSIAGPSTIVKPSRPASSAKSPIPSGKIPRNTQVTRAQAYVESDPHEHPATKPGAVSALATYMLAHRYRLTELEGLAKQQIMASLRIEHCMSVLCATFPYSALHEEILEFVVGDFRSVRDGADFLNCMKEVSSGLWGENGAMILHGLFQKLQ